MYSSFCQVTEQLHSTSVPSPKTKSKLVSWRPAALVMIGLLCEYVFKTSTSVACNGAFVVVDVVVLVVVVVVNVVDAVVVVIGAVVVPGH